MTGTGCHHAGASAAGAWVNQVLILACIALFILPVTPERLAFVPAYLFGIDGVTGPLPEGHALVRLFSHMFVHDDAPHLLGNMIALWVFGGAVEDALGPVRYAVFFVLCGLCGVLTEALLATDAMTPLIGASGAVSGVMSACLLLYPRARVLVAPSGRRVVAVLPAALIIGLEFLGNAAMAWWVPGEGGPAHVAWWGHIGGFVAGMALAGPIGRPGMPLFRPGDIRLTLPFSRPAARLGALACLIAVFAIHVLLRSP